MNEQQTIDAMGAKFSAMMEQFMLNAVTHGVGFLRFDMQNGFSVVDPRDYDQLGEKIVNGKDTAGQ